MAGKMHNMNLHQSSRWTVLGLSCAVLFGQYFCFDIPSVVHDHLSSYSGVAKDDFPWYFNSLYSAYSLPNLLLPLLFGWVLDTSTGNSIILSLALIACTGQLFVTVGMHDDATILQRF